MVLTVSIPFKREGVSEHNVTEPQDDSRAEFQFPSNGKVFPNCQAVSSFFRFNKVSIPFKREGVSELKWPGGIEAFLSVSIPFKREGVSEL